MFDSCPVASFAVDAVHSGRPDVQLAILGRDRGVQRAYTASLLLHARLSSPRRHVHQLSSWRHDVIGHPRRRPVSRHAWVGRCRFAPGKWVLSDRTLKTAGPFWCLLLGKWTTIARYIALRIVSWGHRVATCLQFRTLCVHSTLYSTLYVYTLHSTVHSMCTLYTLQHTLCVHSTLYSTLYVYTLHSTAHSMCTLYTLQYTICVHSTLYSTLYVYTLHSTVTLCVSLVSVVSIIVCLISDFHYRY